MKNKTYKKNIIILLFVLGFLLLFCIIIGIFNNATSLLGNDSQNVVNTSLINLISTPQKFNGKSVRLIGVCELEFEGCGLYFSKDDYDYGISKNAVWIDIDEESFSENYDSLKNMNGKYVIIEGVFESDDNGHLDMYSGSIGNITRFDLWKSRVEREEYVK